MRTKLQTDSPTAKQINCWLLVVYMRPAPPPKTFELPPMEITWFEKCRRIVDQHGGRIGKYVGDEFLCYWVVGGNNGARATDCIESLQKERKTSPLGMILHFGSVVNGNLPTLDQMSSYGPEVVFAFHVANLAVRLKQPLLYSEPAYKELNLGGGAYEEIENGVKGFDGTFRFYAPHQPPA